MTNGEFINKAKYVVAKHTNENILKPEQGLISDNEVFIDGEEMTLKEISEAYNIPITTLYHWRKHKKDRCEFETKVHNYKEEQSIEHEQELQLS